MAEAKVGRRGTLTIPAEVRREAGLEEGDLVKVTLKEPGQLSIEKIPSLSEVQEKLSGKLPPWRELEGKADELIERGI